MKKLTHQFCKLFFAFATVLLVGISQKSFSQTLDQNGNLGAFGANLIVNNVNGGQSFRAGISGQLNSIKLDINYSASPTIAGTFTLTVYSGVGFGGPVLGTQNFNVTSTTGQSGSAFVVDVSPAAINIVSGNFYTFRLSSPTGSLCLFTSNNGYVNGTLFSNSIADASRDIWFQTFVSGPATHLNFDGVNDYISIGNFIPNGSSYTKEAWIYSSQTAGANNILSSSSNPFWIPSGQLAAGNSNNFTAVIDPAIIPVNTWIHAAVTYDAATTTMKLYKNGILVATNTATLPFISENSFIGSHQGGNSLFNGNIDEVRIWNSAQSAADIQRRMNCELQGNESGLIAYYKFNQGTSAGNNTGFTTLTDATAGANNGTLTNFALSGIASNWLAGSPVTSGIAVPAAPSVSPQSFCGSTTVSNLVPAPSATIKWYNVATGGIALAGTTAITTSGNYYATAVNANGCESNRISAAITINTIPAAPIATTQITYTQNTAASSLTATGTNLLWYTVATGGTGNGTAPTPSTAAIGTTSYWVSQTVSSCEGPRAKIDVIVIVKSTATHLNFDGINDMVSIGSIIPNASSYTKEAWIYSTDNTGARNIFSSLSNPFWIFSGNLAAGNNGTITAVQDAAAFPLNTWTHVAVTYDAATTTMKLYKNGVVVSTNVSTPAYVGQAGFIGSHEGTASFFKGNIDEVRIWNVARSAAQISVNINCPLIGNETGLLAYYRFDQGFPAGSNAIVTTLTDATTNNNNGTLSGFALSGGTSNWVITSPVVTGPDVTTPVNYCLNAPATALTVPGTSLLWYTSQFGGTGSSTAPTPATNASGTTSYWVTQPTTGCGESPRTKINVIVNINPLTIAAANKTQVLSVSGNTVFSNNCLDLIATVVPNGTVPVNGNTTSKVWIEGTQPAQFVKRHYEITPASNTNTATARVTLYFTQQEFDDFNAVNTFDLPTNSADATGKANLLIEKRSGVSNDGTGLPSTYTGSIITIDPADADIIWNATAGRWEVSFDVTGFSGFYVKTAAGVLPLRLINFTGTKQANGNTLNWLTADEININQFELERSTDGRSFNAIALINANGNNNYSYTDNTTTDMCWYRLKIMDTNGKFTCSNIVKLNSLHSNNISVYPNPVKELFTIQGIDRSMLKTTVQLVDATGKLIKNIFITAAVQQVNIDNLNKGIYFLRFNNGSVIKVIKE
jgi:hypothetical protein